MARFRLSRPAQADLARILATSAERWGAESRRRYASFLSVAMQQVADNPHGRMTRVRTDLLPDLRSFHLRHTHIANSRVDVREPPHILYYRVIAPDLIQIIRVLHESMEPRRHIDETSQDDR